MKLEKNQYSQTVEWALFGLVNLFSPGGELLETPNAIRIKREKGKITRAFQLVIFPSIKFT